MKFEEKLVTLRKKHGMSQEELADQLGVSRQAISRWELGSTLPDAPNLLKLSDLFDVSIDGLLREGDIDEGHPSSEKESTQTPEKASSGKRRGYLVACIAWLVAGVCFLIAAIDLMSIHLVMLVFVDAILAVVFLWKYTKSE